MAAESSQPGLFTQFPIAEVDRILKRTVVSAGAVGVVGVAVAALLGYPLFGVGLAVGLGLGLLNHRVFQSSAMRFTNPDGVLSRKPFTGTVLLRLGVCTGVAVVLLVFVRQMGWGVVAGLAVFQFVMLVNGLVALLRYQRQELSGSGGGGD